MTQHNIAYGFLRSIALAAALIVTGSLAAHAELHLDITKGKIEPLPIALPDFAGNAPNEVQLGRDLTQVISADLERSGLFLPIDQRAFIEKISTNQTQPRFADWRILRNLKVPFRCEIVWVKAVRSGATAPNSYIPHIAWIYYICLYKRIGWFRPA